MEPGLRPSVPRPVKMLPAISNAFLSPSESSAALYSGPPSLLAITRSFLRMLMLIGMFACRSSSLMTVDRRIFSCSFGSSFHIAGVY